MRKLSSRFRLTAGLVLLLMSVFLSAIVLELLPDRLGAVRQGRASLAEATAIIVSDCASRRAWPAMEQNLGTLVSRNEELLSCAVRRTSGSKILEIGEHQFWQPLTGQFSTDTQVRIPIYLSAQKWGHLELRFTPVAQSGWTPLAGIPTQLLLFLCGSSFLVFYWYLGRMLKQLDPSKAIPPRVRSALDTMAEGLMVLDNQGRIVLANESFSEVAGRSPEDLIGVPVLSLGWKHEDRRPVAKDSAPWQSSLNTGELVRDSILHLESSEHDYTRTFLCNCTPVLGNGTKHGGVLVSLDDITQLEKNKEELKEAQQEAVAANQAKSQFLANMSHEIRTPMNSILGFTEVLRRGANQDAAQQRKHLNTIHSSGTHLLSLINDILDLSKVESGRMEVETIAFEVHRVIAEVVTVMRVNADTKGISLNYEFDGQIPEIIQSDPAKLRQILTNLVGNAIKFTETGGVKIIAKFDDQAETPQIQIQVVDTGIGMTPEQSVKIFDPFSQADTSVTRRFGGTGLGLAISKRFAEALGGGIQVHSQKGVGSVFVFSIATGPIESVKWVHPVQEELEAIAEQATNTFAQLPTLSVLLVDDAEENRDLMSVIMDEIGANYDIAENGQQAVELATNNSYDVILMDMNMPVMDGYTATRKLRQQGHEVPIIALTAHAMSEAGQTCLDAGCTGYLSKPVNLDELIGLLAEIAGVEKIDGPQIHLTASESKETVDDGPNSELPLQSTLDIENPKFLAVVRKFVDRLPAQLELMNEAIEKSQFDELQQLAHWMKGSGPNVGFAEFASPSKKLEEFARDKNIQESAATLEEIKQICQRAIEGLNTTTAPPIPVCKSDENSRSCSTKVEHTEPVLNNNHRKIDKFLSSLDDQLELLQRALQAEELAIVSQVGGCIRESSHEFQFHRIAQVASKLESANCDSDKTTAYEIFEQLLKMRCEVRNLQQSESIEQVELIEQMPLVE